MRLALVTGGAKGIGRSIASRLLDDGMDVAVVDRTEPSAPDSRIRFFKGDVTRPEDLQDLAATLLSLGGVDVLVNNAGIRGPTAPVSSYPLKDWEAVLKLNLTGAFLCCQLLTTPLREKRWGRIINISSMAGKTPYPLRSGYAASEWGLVGLTLTLAGELGGYGITVNAVCPGPVENENMRLVGGACSSDRAILRGDSRRIHSPARSPATTSGGGCGSDGLLSGLRCGVVHHRTGTGSFEWIPRVKRHRPLWECGSLLQLPTRYRFP